MYVRLLPIFSLLASVVVAVQPWGFAPSGRLALGLLPGLVIFYWVARDVRQLSAITVFLCGVVFDVFGGGALGYWPLVFLVAFGISKGLYEFDRRMFGAPISSFAGVVAGMLGTIAALGYFAFGSTLSLYTGLYAVVFASAGYVAVYIVLRLLEGSRRAHGRGFEPMV